MKWFITSRFLKDGTAIRKLFDRELQWKAFTLIFQLLCILLAVLLAYLCYVEFLRNEDFCVVNFKKMYNEDENVHPSMTVCFTSPFDEMKMQQYHQNLNYSMYEEYILGHSKSNNSLHNISYDDVSIDFEKYIQYVNIITNKGDDLNRNTSALLSNYSTKSWSLDAKKMAKCFTLYVPFEKGIKFNSVIVGVRSSLFPKRIRPTNGWKEPFGLHVYFHKHEQFTRSFTSRNYIWPERTTNTSFRIFAYISGVEVLKRRQKPEFPCIDDPMYDSWEMDRLIKTIGCKPPYWNQMDGISTCQTQEDLRNIASQFWETFSWNHDTNPPCTEIKRLRVEFLEKDCEEENDILEFNMVFRDLTYKEIKQNQAYDTKKLIGDIGGYIGLLLGYALLGMPEFTRKMCEYIYMALFINTDRTNNHLSGRMSRIPV